MRYITIFSVFCLLFAAGMLIPVKQAAASDSSDFVDWALDQGETCDQAWNRITAGHATSNRRGDFKGSRDVSSMRSHKPGKTLNPAKSGNNWSRTKSGYIHKGIIPFMPLSTRERKGITRGTGALRHPSRARLNLGAKFRHIPNPRVPEKRFFESRSGNWRIRLKSARRTGKTWQSRPGISRPAFRVDRPKKSRRR